MLPQATLYARLLPHPHNRDTNHHLRTENEQPSTLRLRRSVFSWHIEKRWSGGGSCLRRTGHPFAVSGPAGRSQRIEWVYSASPETIRREPREFDHGRSAGDQQDKVTDNTSSVQLVPSAFTVPMADRSFSARKANHTRSLASSFCISCAPSVQNTPSNAMRLCCGQRGMAKTSATTG